MIQLIAFDMDGTLLTDDKHLLPETLSAIREADAAGFRIALCTGRGLAELAPYPELAPFVCAAVCSSGSVLADLRTGVSQTLSGIGKREVSSLLEAAERFGALPHLLTAAESVVPSGGIEALARVHMGAYTGLYRQCAKEVPDIRSHAMSRLPIPKINLYFPNAQRRDEAAAALRDLPLSFFRSETSALEATPPGTDKASGLSALAESLGLSLSETAAVGDSHNDVPMLQAAGLAAVMKNAPSDVRELADVLLPDNNHDGAGFFLRSLLQGKQGAF